MSKADVLSAWHSQAVSMAVAAVEVAVVVEAAVLVVIAASAAAAVQARFALAARDFPAVVEESARPAEERMIEAVARH